MKNKGTQYSWDPEIGLATCIVTDGTRSYYGIAQCSPDDQDMMNEMTGCYIAECRAMIDFWTSVRDNEVKPKLEAYKHLYYSMNQSSNFNQNSYENKMLQRKIRQTEFDLAVIKKELATVRKDLNSYMAEKAKLYTKIRNQRKPDKVG